MYNIDKIREKLFDAIDSEKDYSLDDFEKEFGNISSNTQKNYKLKVNFLNKSKNKNPDYATDGSSGFDLRADLNEPIEIQSGEIKMVPTGLYFEIPQGLEIQVRPRSGLAAKNGITVLNSPGTVDSDYRGEVKVILINHGKETFVINNGDRIAQAVVASVLNGTSTELNEVSEISNDTDRSSGGFGSTGLH